MANPKRSVPQAPPDAWSSSGQPSFRPRGATPCQGDSENAAQAPAPEPSADAPARLQLAPRGRYQAQPAAQNADTCPPLASATAAPARTRSRQPTPGQTRKTSTGRVKMITLLRAHPPKPPDHPPLHQPARGRLTPGRGGDHGAPFPTASRVPPRSPPRTPPSLPPPGPPWRQRYRSSPGGGGTRRSCRPTTRHPPGTWP
jgi:eukaryotic-like serine/threonine-protein kinase